MEVAVTAPVVDAQPFVAAVRAAVLAAGVLFEEGAKPKNVGNLPYVVGFFDPGAISHRTMRSRDGFSMTGVFHCSGLTPASARVALRKLRGALLGLDRTQVAGWTLHVPVTDFVPPPMQRDDDADPPLYVLIDEWRFRLS